MKYNVNELAKEYSKKENFPKDKHTKNTADIISNSQLNAYTDNDYLSLMYELNQLYNVVDSLTLTEKFILGD